MTITTGNPARDQRLLDAIANTTALGEAATFESVAASLPDDFDLGQDEFALFVPQPVDAEFSVIEPGDGTPATPPPVTGKMHAPERPPTPAEVDEASNLVVSLTNELSQRRADVNVAGRRVQEAIALRARACSQFVARHRPYNAMQLAKDFGQAALASRQAVKDGTMAPPDRGQPGNSVVDRVAFYSRRDDAEGKGNHRRAVLMGGTGQPIHPASARTVAKLPSER
jgi:hypothetical protein